MASSGIKASRAFIARKGLEDVTARIASKLSIELPGTGVRTHDAELKHIMSLEATVAFLEAVDSALGKKSAPKAKGKTKSDETETSEDES